MANLIRTAKSGNEWTNDDLISYNISIEYEDASTFFETDEMPAPSVDEDVLTMEDRTKDPATIGSAQLICHLDHSLKPTPRETSRVVDFARVLLPILGYDGLSTVVCMRATIPFEVCGECRSTLVDVCLEDVARGDIPLRDIPLVIQEDKRHMDDWLDARAQLVAGAIGAFARNNKLRREAGLPVVNSAIKLGIVLLGTTPTFFKIPVTADLVRHVQLGTYPQEKTIVSAHIPSVPSPLQLPSEGMKSLDNRYALLSCYQAFKTFLTSK
ncbi:hypothetical protein PENSPDRAFT_630163 [Peniophora sp. CONT]|nr:hypothetical protein PENSPDRAFT_630163 [Peniophora sp. CONT]